VFVSRLLPEVAALGHEVTHICSEGTFAGCRARKAGNGIVYECRLAPTLPTKDMGVYITTAIALAFHALPHVYTSDAAVCHDIHGSLACLAAKEQGTRCAVYIHMPSGSPVEGEALRQCRAIANSGFTAELLKSVHGADASVAYPAPPYPVEAVDGSKFRSGEPLVVIPSRFQFNKNPGWVLKALERLRERGYRFRAALFGRGASLYGYRYEWLEVLDSVPEEVKVGLYRAATVTVMPSTWEPFGLVALEAIALGSPVLVHRNTGVSEVLNGLGVVDESSIEEVLQQLLGDARHAEELLYRQRGLPIVRRTWRDVASEILSLL